MKGFVGLLSKLIGGGDPPDRQTADRKVLVAYSTLMLEGEANLNDIKETSARLVRVLNDGPNDAETVGHVRDWFSARGVADDIIEGVRSHDEQQVEDAIHRWMAAVVGSTHNDLFNQAVSEALRELGWRSNEVGPIWGSEDELHAVGGLCASSHLRPLVSDETWQHLIAEAERNVGANSKFVKRLREAETG